MVLLKIDVTENKESDKVFQQAFRVVGPPTILFFGPDGLESAEHRITGYTPPEKFLTHITQLQKAIRQ
jgi:thiol:disulfide interchange protein DsbD